MSAAQAAIDAIFGDPNMAMAASYLAGGAGPAVPIRVIRRSPDVAQQFGESRLVSETVRLDVRVADVAAPGRGDLILIGAERLVVQGEPMRDVLRLVWRLEAEPEQ